MHVHGEADDHREDQAEQSEVGVLCYQELDGTISDHSADLFELEDNSISLLLGFAGAALFVSVDRVAA